MQLSGEDKIQRVVLAGILAACICGIPCLAFALETPGVPVISKYLPVYHGAIPAAEEQPSSENNPSTRDSAQPEQTLTNRNGTVSVTVASSFSDTNASGNAETSSTTSRLWTEYSNNPCDSSSSRTDATTYSIDTTTSRSNQSTDRNSSFLAFFGDRSELKSGDRSSEYDAQSRQSLLDADGFHNYLNYSEALHTEQQDAGSTRTSEHAVAGERPGVSTVPQTGLVPSVQPDTKAIPGSANKAGLEAKVAVNAAVPLMQRAFNTSSEAAVNPVSPEVKILVKAIPAAPAQTIEYKDSPAARSTRTRANSPAETDDRTQFLNASRQAVDTAIAVEPQREALMQTKDIVKSSEWLDDDAAAKKDYVCRSLLPVLKVLGITNPEARIMVAQTAVDTRILAASDEEGRQGTLPAAETRKGPQTSSQNTDFGAKVLAHTRIYNNDLHQALIGFSEGMRKEVCNYAKSGLSPPGMSVQSIAANLDSRLVPFIPKDYATFQPYHVRLLTAMHHTIGKREVPCGIRNSLPPLETGIDSASGKISGDLSFCLKPVSPKKPSA